MFSCVTEVLALGADLLDSSSGYLLSSSSLDYECYKKSPFIISYA